MKRKLTKYAVVVLAIWLAKLIYAYAHGVIHHYTEVSGSPYASTALSMLAIILIFYPVFHYLDKYFKKTSQKYIQTSKKVTKSSFWGLVLGFGIAVFLLFMAFANVWYDRNLIQDLGALIGL
ncbi:hypothetical protein RCC89_01500 [Cytophagaceae bacterium ABcell3]|nr:hypothetical protein RCC89_01500 [Cytophagaceae bacterium ABcell3]